MFLRMNIFKAIKIYEKQSKNKKKTVQKLKKSVEENLRVILRCHIIKYMSKINFILPIY